MIGMRAWVLAAVGAALLLPAGAWAQAVRIAPGEEAAFSFDGRTAGEVRRAAAAPTPFEAAVGHEYSGMTPPEAPVPEAAPLPNENRLPPLPIPDPGKLRFRFVLVPGTSHSLLIVLNGYPKALLYRARIWAHGGNGPTDVCLVMPGKPGVEHWPYAISAIEVSAFELVDWKPEDGVPCK